MMKKAAKRKWGALAIALLMTVSFAGCAKGKGKSAPSGLSAVTLWGMPGTEKVYQDISKESDYYKDCKTDAKIDLTVARGEYEGGQIIISADKKEVAFDAQSAALTGGEHTIPAQNVEIFVEKYIDVLVVFENYRGLPVAKYPDALVPMKNIKAVGENVVQKGNNQGLYVRVNIPRDQAVGTYTGDIKLTVDGETATVPVRVNVTEATVSEENRSKSIFITGWTTEKGELDTTWDMVDKYNDALLDYRLNSMTVSGEYQSWIPDDKINEFVEKAYEKMQDPRCSTVTLPYRTASGNISAETSEKIIVAVADKCFETGYNMFDKLVSHFNFIDEPSINGILPKAKTVSQTYNKVRIDAAAEVAEKDADESKISKAEIVESIKRIPHILTNDYAAELDGLDITWCPKFPSYDGDDLRALYADQDERWWYGCNLPLAPYPTYHTDDIWLSARMISWMQAQYDIRGNLYWGTDVYAKYQNNAYTEIDEYYESNADRFTNVNGDGYLFYPGKKYGIDGPVGSLRLEAIRDGLEEYELLLDIKENYADVSAHLGASASLDFESFMKTLTERLYTGAKVSATTEAFAKARAELLSMHTVNAATGFGVIEYSDNGYGEKTFAFAAESGVAVQNNGAALSPVKQAGGYNIYEIKVKLENESNAIALTLTKDGKTYGYGVDLGGAVTAKKGSDLSTAGFEAKACEPTVSVTGEEMKAELPAVTDGNEQSFVMTGANISGINDGTRKVVLHIRYDGTDEAELNITAKHANSRVYSTLSRVKLRNGVNEIVLDFTDREWSKLGALEKIGFVFYAGEEATRIDARTLYIRDVVIYNK